MPGRMPRRLDQVQPLGDLLIAARELHARGPDVALRVLRQRAPLAPQALAVEVGVEAHVRIAQHLEGLGRGALGELQRMADGAGLAQMAVPAAMVEVVVRVDDEIDILRPVAGEGEGAEKRLFLRLQRLLEGQHGIHVVAVEAGVEEIEPVGMVDQHAVDGKAHLARRSPVPVDVEAVDDQGAAVEDEDPGLFHRLAPLPAPAPVQPGLRRIAFRAMRCAAADPWPRRRCRRRSASRRSPMRHAAP